MTELKQVYVLFSLQDDLSAESQNDYLHSIYATREKAEAGLEKLKAEKKKKMVQLYDGLKETQMLDLEMYPTLAAWLDGSVAKTYIGRLIVEEWEVI